MKPNMNPERPKVQPCNGCPDPIPEELSFNPGNEVTSYERYNLYVIRESNREKRRNFQQLAN